VQKAEALIRRGLEFASGLGLEDVSGDAEPARRVARGVIRIVKRRQPRLLVLGYSDTGDPFAGSGKRFGRLTDAVAGHVASPLAIVSLRGSFPFKRLLLPVAGEVNLELMADIVRALGRPDEGLVTFMHLVSRDADHDAAQERLRGLLADHGLDKAGELVVRATENVQWALTNESAKYDLTIVGAPRQRLFARVFGDTAERVARNSPKSVMIIRAKR